MVRQDIVAAVRNALERGETLEQAKTTLANSGYNQGDILEAANYLTGGLGNQPLENHNPVGTIKTQAAPETVKKIIPMAPKVKKKSSKGMIILLISIVIILIAILVSAFIFKDSLISFFQNLFG